MPPRPPAVRQPLLTLFRPATWKRIRPARFVGLAALCCLNAAQPVHAATHAATPAPPSTGPAVGPAAGNGTAPGGPARSSEQTIRAMLARQAQAWNAGDAAAWTRDFAPDADFINILGTLYRGRDETARRHADLFATIFKGSRVDVTVWKVRSLGPGAAVAETIHELRGFARLPPGIRATEGDLLRTRMKYVLSRVKDRWLIVSAQNTPVAPPPN